MTFKRWVPWLALGVVLVIALAIGATRSDGPQTLDSHVRKVAAQIKCPTCQGLSAAESDAAASAAIRDEIRTRIQQGQSDSQIKAFLVSRFGPDILLNPPATGVSSLVWILPVAAFVCALGGLSVAFRRWRAVARVHASPEDRDLVEQALHQ